MTHNEVPRHHWLVRYYRTQLALALRVLSALWLIPRPVAAAGIAWLRRTEVPKKGTAVKSKLVPVLIVVGVVALAVILVARWQSPETKSGTPNAEGTSVPGETSVQLDAWRRPTTNDPQQFAIAYARAI